MQIKTIFLSGCVASVGIVSASCQVSPDEANADITFRGLEASATPNHADGDFVSIAMVGPQGVFICEKPQGGGFTSEGETPIVQLIIDNTLIEEKYYNLDKKEPDEHIVFGATATKNFLNLEVGPHWAVCTAFPDWLNFDPSDNPNDPWFSCKSNISGVGEACTVSGVLWFDIKNVNKDPPDIKDLSHTLDSNCGGGNGDGPKNRQCSGWVDVPKGAYSFSFPCDTGALWEINLQTNWSINDKKKPSMLTSLGAMDAGGNSAKQSAGSGEHDQTYLIVQEGGMCSVQVNAFENARIKLSLVEQVPGGEGMPRALCAGWFQSR
jgi:hypothetical protein